MAERTDIVNGNVIGIAPAVAVAPYPEDAVVYMKHVVPLSLTDRQSSRR